MTIAYFIRGQKHARLADVSIAAARKVMPAAHFQVATDDPEVTVAGAEMVRFDPGLPLMVANLEAQLQILWRHRTPVWFLDTDVLLVKPLPELWDEQIAVTWRDNLGGKLKDDPDELQVVATMPYNFGVIGVQPGPRVIEAFLWMRERVRVMNPDLQRWYGNQLALASLAGPRPASGEAIEQRRIPWSLTLPWPSVTVRKLPGEVYNYTPAEVDEDLTERVALHFKGHSRALMEQYAARLGLPWSEAA